MKFIIKNIGLVEFAEINVGGLTVLAGQNNIGKSYIEKAIYSVVKVNREEYINELDIAANLDGILIIGKPNYNPYIESLFKKEYNNKNNPDSIALLQAKNEENKVIVNIVVAHNKTTKLELNKDFQFTDATLIETPTILSLVAYIRDNLAFAKKSSKLLPDYVTDLVQKLVEGGYEKPTNNPIFNSISQTIQGKLEFDRDNIVYKDDKENAFNINNVASGIKSFGLIQLLLAGESINPQSILIIDEPEVHLHPEWQLEYAKLLVELVKHDIPVVVASHSPYFVEALKVYSDKAKISDKTYFYLGEMGETGSVFKDVTQNLDLLFEKFSTPMVKLIIEK